MANRRALPREMLTTVITSLEPAESCANWLKCLTRTESRCYLAPQSSISTAIGGVHETTIKVAKRAVQAIFGNADITDEESASAFAGAEALLNARPLTYQSANANGDLPLTRNNLMIGQTAG